MGDALRSEAEVLRDQLADYEHIRARCVKQRTLHTLNELPSVIIEARIAARVTQKGLADRLRVKEQQVQRWEATEYAGVSVQRMQEIVDALGATLTETVHFAVVREVNRSGKPASEAPTRAQKSSAPAR